MTGTYLPPLKEVLKKCDSVFHSQRDLWNIFEDERLRLWQEELPEASTVGRRIERVITYLANQDKANGENALALFLRVLAERYPLSDARYQSLNLFASQITSPFSERPGSKDLESNPSAKTMIYVEDVEQLLRRARAVCHIEVQRHRKGISESRGTGTGWLIAPGLVITCWHVVAALRPTEPAPERADLELQIDNMLVAFNYTKPGEGIQYAVDTLIYPPFEEPEQDFAILRLRDRDEKPYTNIGYLPIEVNPPFTSQTELYVIQHPLGQFQQTACDHFECFSTTPGRILYKTPTELGTSGAPVLKRQNLHVVALHNGENLSEQLREGTTIKYILNELQSHAPTHYHSILKAQQDIDNEIITTHSVDSVGSPTHYPTNPLIGSVIPSSIQKNTTLPDTAIPFEKDFTTIDDVIPDLPTHSELTSSAYSQGPLRHTKPIQPYRVLEKFYEKMTEEKKYVIEVIKRLNGKNVLYPDKCDQLLEKFLYLDKLTQDLEDFSKQQSRIFGSERLVFVKKLHNTQILLSEVQRLRAKLCPNCQTASIEQRKVIIQVLEEIKTNLHWINKFIRKLLV